MTGQATVPPPAPAATARSEEQPTGRLARLARLQALQIIIVLAVIVVVFSILKPSAFLTVFNIRGIVVSRHRHPGRAWCRHDVRHHHRWHRPVGGQRPGLQRRGL